MKRRTTGYVRLEDASLLADAREVISAIGVQTRLLADIGEAAWQAEAEQGYGASADELHLVAARLRGVALHTLQVGAELHALVGRLEQIASVREAATALLPRD